MKMTSFNKENAYRTVFMVLLSFAGALLMLIIIGTIFGLLRPSNSSPILVLGSAAREEISTPAQGALLQTDDIRLFADLQRLRIPLADSSVMILSIVFPYDENDLLFTEELFSRVDDFRRIAAEYFSALPQGALIPIDEAAANREILRRFNNNLRLGQIPVLHFSDMIIIDGAR